MIYDRVPTFRPTITEWNEGLEAYTRKYVENTPEVKRSGLARVIPPKEWKWLRKNAFENVNDETFKPIRQCTSTRAGVTRCQIQEMKTSTISEFETFVKKSHATPSNIEEKLKRNDNIIDEECIAKIERAFWKTSLSHTSKPGVYVVFERECHFFHTFIYISITSEEYRLLIQQEHENQRSNTGTVRI